MTIAYITRAEVHTAADQIDADGQKPAAKSIREITGRGSFSTITAHLASWKPRDQRLSEPPVPDGLASSVGALTADLWHIARTAAQAETIAQIEQAAADVAEARAAAAASGKQADRFAAELGTARKRIAELEQMVAARDQQSNECAEYIRQLEVEEGRKAGEIDSLRHMVAQFTPAAAGARKIVKKADAEQPAA
jgi:hypothetical protein